MAKLLIKDGVRIGGGGVRIDTEGVVRHESDTLNPINRIDGGDYDSGTLDVIGPGETGGGEAIHVGAAVLFSGFTVTSVLGLNNGVDINDAGGSFSTQPGVVVGAKLQFSTGTGEVDATIHLIRPGTFNGQAFTRIFFLTTHTGIVAGDTISLHQNIVRELDSGEGITIPTVGSGGVATIDNDWGNIPTENRYDGAVLQSANLGADTSWGSPFNQIRTLGDVQAINLAPGDPFVSEGDLYQYNPNAAINTTVTVGDDLSSFIGPILETTNLWGTAPTGTKPRNISWNEVISPVVHDSITGVFQAGDGPLGSGFMHPGGTNVTELLFTFPDESGRDLIRDQYFIPKIRAIGPLVNGIANARVIDRTEDVGDDGLRLFFEGELTVLASDAFADSANIEIFTVAAQTIHTIEGGTYDNGILTITDETGQTEAQVNTQIDAVRTSANLLTFPNTQTVAIPAGFSSEAEALFSRVDNFGTFQDPAVLPTAITPYDTTTHLVLGATAYYIHYRTTSGSTAATLTTVADTATIIFTYNIN